MRCFLTMPRAPRLATAVAAGMLVAAGTVATTPTLMVGVANAHDVVLSSDPADGATVEVFPRTITLEFSAIPKDKFNTFAVSNADTGEILYTATPERDQQMMSITLPESIQPGDGRYILGYQITSSDGHATRGKLGFTVSGSSTPAQDSGQHNSPTADHETTIPTGDSGATESRRTTTGPGEPQSVSSVASTPGSVESSETSSEEKQASWPLILGIGVLVSVVCVVICLVLLRRK